ncbi:MAG: DUF4403 family protein, partial [Chitinispirillales bacterium]|nr:DUF4403 family protein [Chitinispirillales bacterium]
MRSIFIIPVICIACAVLNCAGKSAIGTGGADGGSGGLEPVPSVINIPAEISVAYIERIINEQLGGTLYSDNSLTLGGFSNVAVSVRKNGNIR